MNSIYVLGLGAHEYQCAALLRDGRIVAAGRSDRMNIKTECDPRASVVRHCLSSAGIEWSDLALVAMETYTIGERNRIDLLPKNSPRRRFDVPHVHISRTTAYAWAAAAPACYQSATVAVLGAEENSANADETTMGTWHNGQLKLYSNNTTACGSGQYISAVNFYRKINKYLFGPDAVDEMLMTFASYGTEWPSDLVALRVCHGRIEIDHAAIVLIRERLADQHSAGQHQHGQVYANIALWAQQQVEYAVLQLAENWYAQFPSPNLAYGGELSFNTRLNDRITTETPFEQVYVQPLAKADSAAVGCCFYGWSEVLGGTIPPQYDHSSWYPDAAGNIPILAATREFENITLTDCLMREIVKLLRSGRKIGWFESGSRLGGRDLGHRSILEDPRVARYDDSSEATPPVALIQAEECVTVFATPDLTQQRLCWGRIRPYWVDRLPGLARESGVVEVQCVTDVSHIRLHALLSQWTNVTGVPILKAMPMGLLDSDTAETADQALSVLRTGDIEALVLDNQLLLTREVR